MDPMGTIFFPCQLPTCLLIRQVAQRYRLRPGTPGVSRVFLSPKDKAGNGSNIDTIWAISSDHQLSLVDLVVYPMIYKVLYISGGCFSPDF